MQELLSGIYDLPTEYCVYDFLFTERERLPRAVRDSDTDEQVLVLDQGDSASVGLFLDPRLLERLAAANPLEILNGSNLADYWTALEGVSHFLCLAWNAGHDRGVTLLELELQAEIDKYVASWWLLRQQHPGRYPAEAASPVVRARAHVDLRSGRWTRRAATRRPINTRRAFLPTARAAAVGAGGAGRRGNLAASCGALSAEPRAQGQHTSSGYS